MSTTSDPSRQRPRRTAALALLLACAAAPVASADPVAHWNAIATEALAPATDPLTESRILAILHVAVHDALNTVEARYERYASRAEPTAGASADAAIAAAAHAVLAELVPSEAAAFEAAREAALGAVPDGEAEALGIAVGTAAARTILDARRQDGSGRVVERPAGTRPGEYRPTPPDFTAAFFAHWGEVTPFVLRAPDQFRPAPPPAVDGELARADMEEVRVLGAAESAARTAEQSEIARYWYEGSTQGWNRIARQVVAARPLEPWQSARLFALLNLAMADGFIAGFDAKYHYGYWRPASMIREAADAEWLSFLPTPPVPDYPSTHTVLGATAARVLARALGTDFVSFEMTSGVPYPGITRSFWSFSQAAQENGASRVLAGIHFQTAVRAGHRQGEEVGDWVVDHALRPLATAPGGSAVARR